MNPETTQPPPVLGAPSTASYTLRDLLLYFLRLGTLGFGGPNRIGGPHAERPGGGAQVGVEAGLPRRSRFFSALPWTFGRPIGNVSRLGASRRAGSHSRRHRLHSAFLLNGARSGRALRSLRQLALDSRHVLRNWRGGNRDHRPKRNQTSTDNSGKRLAPVDNLCRPCDHNSLDQVRNCLALRLVRRYRNTGYGASSFHVPSH